MTCSVAENRLQVEKEPDFMEIKVFFQRQGWIAEIWPDISILAGFKSKL
jgi:hypothetical protein